MVPGLVSTDTVVWLLAITDRVYSSALVPSADPVGPAQTMRV